MESPAPMNALMVSLLEAAQGRAEKWTVSSRPCRDCGSVPSPCIRNEQPGLHAPAAPFFAGAGAAFVRAPASCGLAATTHAPPVGANKTGTRDAPPQRGEVTSASTRVSSHAERSIEEIPPIPGHRSAEPAMAHAPANYGAGVVQHRPARRQPGAVRAHEPRDQEAPVQDAGPRWASRKSRWAFRRLRIRISRPCAISSSRSWCPTTSRSWCITQAREELIRRTVEVLRGARRAIVHVYNATAPGVAARGVRHERAGSDAAHHEAGRAHQATHRRAARNRMGAGIFARDLQHDRAAGGARGLQRRDARLGRRPRPADHHQSADDGGERDAEHVRRPDRMDVDAPRAARARRALGAHA